MSKQKNFIVIVADDLGYSDIGCYGSEIQTPNIDSLASDGRRFTDFHTAAACSPTRSMLLSGTDHHLAGLGELVEFVRQSPAHIGKPGHEGYLTENVATLPEVLKEAGYYTFMAGKWHLGLTPETSPSARGFDKSFSFLPGCGNHYAWEPQLKDRSELPRALETAMAALHIEDQQYFDNDDLPEDFYSTDFYTDKLIEYMKNRPKDKPFFCYLPFTAPHWPLQAPDENTAKYKGFYDDGPVALRERRLKGLVEKGLLDPSVEPHDVVNIGIKQWEEMTGEERAKSARSMEVYAGMVDRIDYNVGKVIEQLKKEGIYDETCIIFMSDNGAAGASYEAIPMTTANRDLVDHVGKYYNNSLENIGQKDSFVWYGCLWAQAATAPSRLYKMFSTEGGCRVPFVFKEAADSAPGEPICSEFCTVMDLMPTFLETSGVPKPGKVFNGREVLRIKGESWVPYLRGKQSHIHDEEHVTGWALAGHGALRKGKWKIDFVAAPVGPGKWELFDLSKDPGETNDLGDKYPELLQELIDLWDQYAKDNNVVGLAPQFKDIAAENQVDDPRMWMQFDTS